jgi:hypothetical protein
LEPLHRTLDVGTKPVPFTVSVKDAPPAVTDVGLILVVVGRGLKTVKVCALEVPPPGVGLKTLMLAV